MYRTLNEHYRQRFGCKVYKLSIDAGMTCPNRDGTLGTGGCIFCGSDGGGAFAEGPRGTVAQQLERAKARVRDKIRDGKVQAAGAIVGAVMRATRGQADAARVRELVMERASEA